MVALGPVHWFLCSPCWSHCEIFRQVLAHLAVKARRIERSHQKHFADISGGSGTRAFARWLAGVYLTVRNSQRSPILLIRSPCLRKKWLVSTLSKDSVELRFVPSAHTWDVLRQ